MTDFQLFTPTHWFDYELIDSGSFEKLERFGSFILARPEPQACWNRSQPVEEWMRKAHAVFRKDREAGRDEGQERGRWELLKPMPDRWNIEYRYAGMKIIMRLALTAFKHVGVFPEQAVNWNFIYDTLAKPGIKKEVLNLFAYTGGASLAAASAGCRVVHLDAVKAVVNWARDNAAESKLEGIRWIAEDAMRFAHREVRRNHSYDGIILDPPAYGRGTGGEKWVFGENINELIRLCSKLLKPTHAFLILNFYSMGFSALVAENLIKQYIPDFENLETGELFVPDSSGNRLPLGTFVRLTR